MGDRRTVLRSNPGRVVAGFVGVAIVVLLVALLLQPAPKRPITAPVEVRRVRTLIVTGEGSVITTASLDVVPAVHEYSIAGAWWKGFDGKWHHPLPSAMPECTPDGSRGAILDLGVVRPEKRTDAVTGDPFVVWVRCISQPTQRGVPQPSSGLDSI